MAPLDQEPRAYADPDPKPEIPALMPTYAPYPFPVVGGKVDQIFDAQGNAYWDFYGGHCVSSTGHSHPKVVAAIREQAEKLLFYSTAASLPVRDAAAQSLVSFARAGGRNVVSTFFCNSGAEANENALKVAALLTGRQRFASFSGGWHGRTALALSVTDDPPIQKGLEPLLAPVDRLPFPSDAESARAALAFDFSKVAAVILEPIQSMSGVRVFAADFLRALRQKTQASGTLLIFDEVQTGMGRTGAPFFSNGVGIDPDIITSAKGLASGVPMGAVLFADTFARKVPRNALGSTFGGSPVACAALIATIGVIKDDGLMARATETERFLRDALAKTVVTAVRGQGMLLGLVAPKQAVALKTHLMNDRILVGSSHDPDVLRLMPPLVTTKDALAALVSSVRRFSA